MSNKLMKQCRAFRMTLTAKAVLMALADIADDDGHCWPSLETLAVYTCASKRAVIDAIKYLEAARVLVSDRSNGRKTTYVLTPDKFVPIVVVSARTEARRKQATGANAALVDGGEPVQMPHGSEDQTSADAAPVGDGKPVQMPHGSSEGPVQMPHSTGADAAPEPVQMPHKPVRQPHSNHQEPPIEPSENHQLGGDDLFDAADQQADTGTSKKSKKAAGFDASLIDLPDWLDRALWCLWVHDRATRKKPLTKDAARLSVRSLNDLRAQGHAPRDVIENAIASGWQGLYAPPRRAGSPSTSTRRPTSHNGLDTKNYHEGITEDGHPA